MIGKCDECDRKRVSLLIYDEMPHGNRFLEELEDDGEWEFRYTNTCCCIKCYMELTSHIIEEYELLLRRRGELNDDDLDDDENDEEHPNPDPVNPDAPPYGSSPEYEDPPAYDEPVEIFNYDWKPIAIRI